MIRRIFLTLLAAGLTYLITNMVASGQSQSWGIIAYLFIGGVTLVVQFLIDFEKRLEKVKKERAGHLEEIRFMIREEFAGVNKFMEGRPGEQMPLDAEASDTPIV